MQIVLKRNNGDIICTQECSDLRAAVEKWKADLREANLSGADLTAANLSGANLSDATLSDATLSDATLSDATLRCADLSGANLSGANLTRTNLTGADLSEANLHRANLTDANLRCADLNEADLSGAIGLPAAPALDNPDQQILDALRDGGELNMETWHACQTTHCIAGWLVTLAGPEGKGLERIYGTDGAGALIYHASRPHARIPDFYASNEEALEQLRQRAREGA